MSNKIVTTESGAAKLSWEIKYGDSVLDNVDKLTIFINDEKIELDGNVREYSCDIQKDTEFRVMAEYNGLNGKTETVSNPLYVDMVGGPVYVGSVLIQHNDEILATWDQEIIDNYIKHLPTTIKSLLTEGIETGDQEVPVIAEPGKLLKLNQDPLGVYGFITADENVPTSFPIVLLPEDRLKVDKGDGKVVITDDLGVVTGIYNPEYTITIDDIVYTIFIAENASANEDMFKYTFA